MGRVAGGLVQHLHQQVHRHLVEAENVQVVLIALKSEIVVFWEQLSLNVSATVAYGVHPLSKENLGVFTNQEEAQQHNHHLEVLLAMLQIVQNEIADMLEPINSHAKLMVVVGNQFMQPLVFRGVIFQLKMSFFSE